jgi:hypothetical protein
MGNRWGPTRETSGPSKSRAPEAEEARYEGNPPFGAAIGQATPTQGRLVESRYLGFLQWSKRDVRERRRSVCRV